MTPYSTSTPSANDKSVERRWYVIDAAGQTLGRFASQIAHILRGKHKPYYTPHVDCGDYVVVINAAEIEIDPKRRDRKEYYHNTQYPGGARFKSFTNVMAEKPEFAITHAVKGMLPKNALGRDMLKKLRVYAGNNHEQTAQQPVEYRLPYNSKK